MEVKVPTVIKTFWIIVLPGLLLIFGRMSYECIYLTLKNGPQMVGFSLIHLHPQLYLYMFFSYLASVIWTITFLIWYILTKLKKQTPVGLKIYILTVIIVVFTYLFEPISKILN